MISKEWAYSIPDTNDLDNTELDKPSKRIRQMNVRTILKNARHHVETSCNQLQSAHTKSWEENKLLDILLLDLIKEGREMENRLKRIVALLEEK